MSLKDIKNPTYFELNNQINIPVNGQIPLHKDKEAVTAFLNENVKPNRLFTYHPNTGVRTHESLNADVSTYMDKLEWLIAKDYYEEPFIRAYRPEFIEELREWLHNQNFTFYSFMAAYKFYKQYALKTNTGEYYLEDPEDRALMNALYQANGDETLAKDLARVVITRRYQPATPTYANNGRKRRGEFASCFPAGTMISTDNGEVPIENIKKGMKVLTHDLTFKTVTETMKRTSNELVVITIAGQADPIVATPEHPFLTTVLKAEDFESHAKANFTDGLTENTFWSEIKDLKSGDFIAVNPNRVMNVTDETYLERDGFTFVRVLHVETNHKADNVRVYNMDVEDNHTYVASNAIVHNCFIIQVQDNMSDIGRSITNALQLSRKAGGVGLILGNLRAAGSPIKKMDGLASGVLPVMKLFEDSFSYSNQLGTRPGAGVAYLPIFHADVMEFLSSKKENADEKIRLKTLSLGLTVPDKFYELAKAGSKMAIFDPYFVEKELGQSFTYVDMDKEYEHLVELSKQVDEETGMPKIRVKWIEARALEQAISELQQESGYPYIINISTANKANPIEGRILGSNLCSEILQIQTPSVINEQQEYTTLGQDIVCNLGSTNIINMMSAGESFGNDIIAMTKGLTFISDASDLAFVQTIDNGNSKNHAIGLGAMGLHSFLANNQIQYESKDAVDFTGLYFLLLNYYTIMGSMQIAKERKQSFDNFENSDYASGEYFDKYLTKDYTEGVSDRVMDLFKDIHIPTAEDWAQLKLKVGKYGMFNAYRIALAPNGSISYVNDCSASIAPIVNRIEERQEGQVGKIYYPTFGLSNESIPYFKSAYDQDMRWQIRIYEAATEHTDQGLSMNMYLRSDFEEHPGLYEWKEGGTTALTTRDLTILRHFAWRHGIKSMYYTRQYTADSDSEHGGANECESCMI